MHNQQRYTSYPGTRRAARGLRRRSTLAPLCVLILASLACSLPGRGDSSPTPAIPTAAPPTTAPAAATQPPESLPGPTQVPTSLPVPTQPPPAAATETTAPLPVPQTGYLGDADEQAGYFLSAAAVEDPYAPEPTYPLGQGNKIVAVEITVGNQSGQPIPVNYVYTILVDQEGFTYLVAPIGVEDPLIPVELQPGQRVRGLVAFEVPEAAVPAAVRYELVGISDVPLEVSLTPPPAGHTPAEPTAQVPSRTALPRLGETVQENGYSLSAVNFEDPAPAGPLYTPREGRKLVAVEIVLANQSEEVALLNPLDALLVDSEGYVYAEQLGGREGELAPVSLNPGETAQGWVAFSIPETSVPASLIYLAFTPSGRVYLETGVRQ